VDLPERAARNEEVFRGVNVRIEQGAEQHGVDRRLPFHCECGRASCFETVELAPDEYDRVASHRFRFVIVPGHELPEIETVVTVGDRYAVVEKQGEAREQINRDHPRDRHRDD
jgi:hypothetical protein